MAKIKVVYEPAVSVCEIFEPITLFDFLNSLYGQGTEIDIIREDGSRVDPLDMLTLGNEDLTIIIRLPFAIIETQFSSSEN